MREIVSPATVVVDGRQTMACPLRANAAPGATNVATVNFDVVVDPSAMDGLIIENQGFVSSDGAGSGPQPDQPSDDPDTPVPDEQLGTSMLYSSGTTGRPKGIIRPLPDQPPGQSLPLMDFLADLGLRTLDRRVQFLARKWIGLTAYFAINPRDDIGPPSRPHGAGS